MVKKIIKILTVIGLLIIIIITINTFISPQNHLLSSVWSEINSKRSYLDELSKIRKENSLLKTKEKQLKFDSQEIEQEKRKNIELSKLLAFKDQFKENKLLGANIIDIDENKGFCVTIDRGSIDSVTLDDAVISSNGLVGRVSSVKKNSAEVTCIIDSTSRVAATTKGSGCDGIINGCFGLESKIADTCKMLFLSNDVNVNYGDKIITSGIGGVFPKGIPIGQILEVRKSDNDINYYATVKPAVDFKKLEFVAVLIKNKS
ncbi:MAG TPA: rod shape-determining protein MreC [Pseudobacteroides sp.]|uniref:rod shape-determining protein MreC n=1 Tax=Pseudobacteroides sp. TaxID=1968840 RepID=UPI002F94A76F